MFKPNTTYSSRPSRAARHAHRLAKEKYPTYDTSLIVPKKKKKPYLKIALIILIIVLALFGIIFFSCTSCSKTLEAGKDVEVEIPEGATVNQIADILKTNGVIDNTFAFCFKVNTNNISDKLQSGFYYFEGGKSIDDYINQLCEGSNYNLNKLLIYEGQTIKEIAKRVEESSQGQISQNSFIDTTKNIDCFRDKYSFLDDSKIANLEGFLMPDTYYITKKDNAESLINKMLNNFNNKIKNLDFSIKDKYKLSFYDMINLASIVEKESTDDTSKKVASVFYNRLAKNMYLNSDATMAYVVGHDPTPNEVHSNSPYSTYSNKGLPPTPICNPGFICLEAVCNPENTNYLYFYFKQDKNGNMQYKFSETYQQHQQAIKSM